MTVTMKELNELAPKIKYLPRDVRLAALSSILKATLETTLAAPSGTKSLYQCDVAQSIAFVAEILGFFDESEELGLLPQHN